MSQNKEPPVPTIKEIARLAGVSIGTVDRVLHDRGRVSVENVDKIRRIVENTGYKPNLFASKLSGRQATQIGVMMPDPTQDSGYWKLCRDGMERAAKELEPFQISVDYSFFDRNSESSCVEAFSRLQQISPDGWLLAPIHEHVFIPMIEKISPQVPLLFFDTDLECRRPKCFIGQDPFQGGYVAGRLAELLLFGSGKPALVFFDDDDPHLSKRSEGFTRRCREKGVEPAVLHQFLGASPEKRAHDLKTFLWENKDVRVLFVPNVQINQYAGAVPDLKLIGYDLVPENVRLLKEGQIEFLISQRPEAMGYESIRGLYRQLLLAELLPAEIILPIDVLLKENVDLHS